ncbi:MAG: hypothetical protein ACTHKE_04350 [Sphingomicrobium sp.]
MAEGIQFPDGELAVCNLLRNTLLNVPVVADIPATRPPEFVRVIRTGGVRETFRSEAGIFAIEAWAQKKARAVELANKARAILNAADGAVFGVRELAGPAYLPDPESTQIRYTMSVQARTRGSAVTV